jgi:HNH endonuclease
MSAGSQLSLSHLFDNPPTRKATGQCIDCGGDAPLRKRSFDKFRKRCFDCEIAKRNACSLLCQRKAKSGEVKPAIDVPGVPYVCTDCGEEKIGPGKGRPRKRCGDCASASIDTYRRERRAKISAATDGELLAIKMRNKAAARKRLEESVRQRRSQLRCKQCGGSVAVDAKRYRFCSEDCAKKNVAERKLSAKLQERGLAEWPEKDCQECGDKFVAIPCSDKERRFCSRKCGKKNGLRIKSKKRRARMFTLAYFEFSPMEIYRRDGWKCTVCGVDTPETALGTGADDEPNMDHIVPLSRGGDHHPANTRCLCRKCNIDKGALLDKEWNAKKRARAKAEKNAARKVA